MLGGLDYHSIAVAVRRALLSLVNIPTSKGDLWTSDGTQNQKLTVGANGLPLVTDSTQTTGLKWGFSNQSANQFYGGPSSGAAAAPSFRALTAADGASAVLIATNVLSASATCDFTSGLTGFDAYAVEFVNVVPTTNTVNLIMQMSINAGGAWQTAAASYAWYTNVQGSNAIDYSTSSASAVNIQINGGTNVISNTSASGGLCGWMHLFLGSASQSKHLQFNVSYAGTVAYATAKGFGVGQSATIQGSPVNGLRFLFDSGTMASGTVRLWGIRNS